MNNNRFGKVLESDEMMQEIKVRLETAKEVLIGVNCEAITRMRELMAIDSNGEVGEGSPDSECEIPSLVLALSEALAKELAVRQMDILMPDWQDRAAEASAEIMAEMLLELMIKGR